MVPIQKPVSASPMMVEMSPNIDIAPVEGLDRLTRLATYALNVPTALISLVDNNRQWFKARCGFEGNGMSLDVSFCAHVVATGKPLIVTDALSDARFVENPLVRGAPFIRFYAGFPIHSQSAEVIGTFCVIDFQERNFTKKEISVLEEFAKSAEELIFLRQLAQASYELSSVLRNSENHSSIYGTQLQHLDCLLSYDGLGEVKSRNGFTEQLQHAVKCWEAADASGIVAYIDLDNFRNLNGSHGPYVADMVLQMLGQRLRKALPAGGIAARVDSDEFIAMWSQPVEGQINESVLAELSRQIREPLYIQGYEIAVGCTIGYAHYPTDSTEPAVLLTAANVAMHHAKSLGRGIIQRHRATNAHSNARLETDLRQALQNNEFEVHYQPKVNLRTGRITGVEALLRWRHAELGMVPPSKFIPLAEENGLIVQIGEWVLHTACKQIREWIDAGLGGVPVAVNLSGRQLLNNDIIRTIQHVIEEYALGPGMLEMELTESVSMRDPKKSAEVMHKLRGMGVTLAIDDFGTGYSSLSYLKRLPIDKIKIDRSFVSDMTEDADSLSIVQAIITLAHRLNLSVVAEGVESEKQLTFLALNLCEEMQGYYFSKPLPAEECTELLSVGRTLSLNQQTGMAIAALFGCR
ncbi:sensor domain-containing phosphodiesterase [Noviherbaspirillum sp. DKR-6]|uniref:Sensor domain-containing phosphodiesterase n=2 Tax=Noviherbaspirillum pedocola TaxID=2801341 RepID=A0A934T3S1_9BURK|nr:sensor domain-containing phosphodiesterase [Noviherbaspirillum pedocola]